MKKITLLAIAGLMPYGLFLAGLYLFWGIRTPIMLGIALVIFWLAVKAGIIICKWIGRVLETK